MSIPQSRRWCFTLNNPTLDDESRISSQSLRYLVFGREIGDSGTKHLQGFCIFNTPKKLQQLQHIFAGRAHWEVTRGNDAQASDYCKKDGDYVEQGVLKSNQGSRSDLKRIYQSISEGADELSIATNYPEQYSKYYKAFQRYRNLLSNKKKKTIKNHELYDWQKVLIDEFKEQADERSILFVIDPEGNKGKSWFCYYCLNNLENVQLIDPGKKADMAYELDPQTRILLVDCARSRKDILDYHFLEKVKDGIVFSPKYESSTKFMNNNVHVVVFMNESPDDTKLSEDRYRYLHL